MPPRTDTINFRLESLTASGGETVHLPEAGITCIVGGKNVGKSRLCGEQLEPLLGEQRIGQRPRAADRDEDLRQSRAALLR